MYLKSIDMYGFKSFATKMIFKFDKGITGVVGPNGSGKSNIADAVRWVLGEQSAKMLRGTKMQDVIFAGTETRKPLGYCQVDLTIDNSDLQMPIEYTEITVSRRVYRSGEGEYYINGVECRLKDIQELFMDTGVGKEGYSIIGQGQIDIILSSKPEDRRELFDEAAGIVKYKRRKATAQKNLEEERQNLVRINDIIRELEGQKQVLEGQAEVARQYLKLKESLKKYEVNIYIHEAEKLIKSIEEINQKEEILQAQIEEIKQSNAQIKEKYAELSEVVESLERDLDALKNTKTEKVLEKEKKENNMELIKEQINHIIQNCERIQRQNEELKQKETQILTQKQEYDEKMRSISMQFSQAEAVLKEKQQALEDYQSKIIQNEAQMDTLQTDMIERLNEISNVKTKMQRFQTMLENLTARKESLESRKLLIASTQTSLEEEIEKGVKRLDDLNLQKTRIASEKNALTTSLEQKGQLRNQLDKQIRDKSDELQTSKSKYKALNELTENYEGYSYSIKKIMELKKQNPSKYVGVLGVVADIIEVDKTYEVAIEIALGGSVQNIVTDNEITAKELIEYLRHNKYGRATFLPLTSIAERDKKPAISQKEPGFLGFASELVSFENKYKNIVEYLLGRVVVVDTMDNAILLAKKHQYSLKIVTLTGELINPGGALTGGAYKNQSNQFLSRKRELEAYEANISALENEMVVLSKRSDELNESLSSDKNALEDLNKNDQELSIQLNNAAMHLKQLENEIQKIKDDISDIDMELQSILSQESELTSSSEELKKSLEGSQALNDEAEDSVRQLAKDNSAYKLQRDTLNEEVTRMHVEVNTYQQQLENGKENVLRIERELKEIQRQLNNNVIENDQGSESIAQKEALLASIQKEIETIAQEISDLQNQIEEKQEEKKSISEEQQALYTLREEKNEQISLLEKDILRLQNGKIKYEMQKENSDSYMWNEYELTYNSALEYKDESLGSVSTLRKLIGEHKEQIKALGDVNVNAIEDFKTVSERYIFLTEQKEDLIKAEEKLVKVIEELQEQMTKQFREKFKEITVKFNEVFQELFGGGKAFLELTDDEDILEAGIDINAQPPGKKLQNMRLLSGGEKALTAISLLFAIQSLKPSPFCVLDEIEAALDDANVVRFAKYLKKLTANTQFIIITHRRGTMEAADCLYGITMQEKGVSTQVSVKLLEDTLS